MRRLLFLKNGRIRVKKLVSRYVKQKNMVMEDFFVFKKSGFVERAEKYALRRMIKMTFRKFRKARRFRIIRKRIK